jgi:hypothetical protein
MHIVKRMAVCLTAMTFGATTLLAHAPEARADEIAGTPKAIIGGAFLGAEVVIIPMGIAGVRAGWAYAVFPPLGAIGGAIGGFFMDQAYDNSGKNGGTAQPAYGSAFMLAGGMALIIPAVVLMLNATRYHPSAEATEDRAPTNVGPEANPGNKNGGAVVPTGGEGSTQTTTPPPPPPPPAGGGGAGQPPYVPLSLLDVHDGSFRMGIPVPEVHNAYSMREVKELGVKQATELRVPVFKLAF